MSASIKPQYVPILKWRMGEYQSLLRLADSQKELLMPLIELCPPEFDFETGKLKKTIDDQLSTFAKRLKEKWGARPGFLDAVYIDPADKMVDGRHPLRYIFDEIRTNGARLVPVTGLERTPEYQAAIKEVCSSDKFGVCIRLSLEDITDPDFDKRLKKLLKFLGNNIESTDLVIDLRGSNFEPIASLSKLILNAIRSSECFSNVRSVTIAGTSFPASMAELKKDLNNIVRSEWLLFKHVISALQPHELRPMFGDYCVASPDLLSMDMRYVKPNATVRYAVDDGWLIAKGKNVRDHGFGQFVQLCDKIVKSPGYLGKKFSKGSEYISKCSGGSESTGALTTWRWVGTNHHMAKVVFDLANLYGT